jgi:glycerate-2-kinase
MSDVRDDRPDVIASGPAAPDPTTFSDALAALTRHGVAEVSPRLTAHLRDGVAGRHRETLKPGDPAFARVVSRVIASNQIVKDAVADAARQLGAFVIRDHRWISGGAAAEGQRIGSTVRRLLTVHPRAVFLAGGEPVVNVGDATGTGGPSQELALAAARELDGAQRVLLACFSTDGIDGPTRHAGAIVSGDTAAQARSIGTDLADVIARHDSSTLLERLDATITTGPTGTNLNHVMIALLAKAV